MCIRDSNEANLTLCILDNSTTAMTGHQPHPGTGHTMMGQVVDKIDITKVLEGIGVRNIVTVDALDLDQCVDAVLEISAKKGVGAVIFKAPCIAIVKTSKKCRIVEDKCVNCRTCINEIGCPALVLDGDMAVSYTHLRLLGPLTQAVRAQGSKMVPVPNTGRISTSVMRQAVVNAMGTPSI